MIKMGMIVICMMNNFNNLPSKLTGRVVLKLKNTITVMVMNNSSTQSIEITFDKKYCKEDKNGK